MELLILTYTLGLFIIQSEGTPTLTVPTAGNCGDDTVLTCHATGSITSTSWSTQQGDIMTNGNVVRPDDSSKYTETRETSSFTLTIHNTDISDAGEYKCRSGFDVSDFVQLNIECKASAGVTSVTNGKKITVTVDKLYPASPTFTAAFKRGNVDVTIPGSRSCSSSTQHPGYYRCVWSSSNSLADGSYTYSIVVTTITQAEPLTGTFQIVSPQAPVISNTENLDDNRVVVYGNEGQSLTIQCTSTGGYPVPTVTWYMNSVSGSNQLATTSTGTSQSDGTYTVTLQHTLTPTVADDRKTLICRSYYPQADNAHTASQTTSVILYLISEGWPCVSTVAKKFSRVNRDAVLQFDMSAYVNQQTTNTFSVRFHDNTILAQVVYASGAITYNKLEGLDISADLQGNIIFTKQRVGTADAGIYYISSSSTPTRCSCLYILGIPKKASISATSVPSVGGNVTLLCSSTSTTTPSNHSLGFRYSWGVDNTDDPSGPRYTYFANTLTLSNIVKDDVKLQFSCAATEDVSNGYTSSQSDILSLDISYGPETVVFFPSATSYEREENYNLGEITCTASCNPPCTFKWNKVGQSSAVSNNAVLNLGVLSRSDAGTYRCTAMSSGGANVTKDLIINVIYVAIQSFYVEGYLGQQNATVDEHYQTHFKCIVDSNSKATVKISFGGNLLEERTSASLSFFRNDVACLDAGVYVCEGSNEYGRTSTKDVTLFVRCSPRPVRQIQQNITSDLNVPLTLSFTALAFPEPGPKGFSWQKENGERWIPLLGNSDLKIKSSGLQSNLTLLNVFKEDYGHYKVIVTNEIGAYEQHLFVSENVNQQPVGERCKMEADSTSLIVGITLGAICCIQAIFAVYLMINKRRMTEKETKPTIGSSTHKTFTNLAFSTDVDGNQEQGGLATGGEEALVHQYTDLSHYANSDKNTYEELNKA